MSDLKLNNDSPPMQVAGAMLQALNEQHIAEVAVHKFGLSFFSGCKDNAPKGALLDWPDFCLRFSKHAVRRQKDGPAWSPATFIPAQPRRNETVDMISFAVIDVDDGTPYADVEKRFDGFSFLVHSSYSHSEEKAKYRVIFPLANAIPAKEWHGVWERINKMAGGCNDASTKDLARIYYMPAHPVGDKANFIHIREGRFLSVDDLPHLPEGAEIQPLTFHRNVVSGRLNETDGIESSGPELNFEQGLMHVVQRCAFMQFASFCDNQETLSEPLWMAMISNACRFERSEDWIHAASASHARYQESETQNRIERYRNGPPPVTCQRIRELGFQQCPSGGCARPNGNEAKAPAALGGWMFQHQLTVDETELDQIPDEYVVAGSFLVKPSGVYQIARKRDGDPEHIRLCTRVDVTARTRDAESSNWGTELCFTDPDGIRKTWALPMELLASNGESYRASLLKLGLMIEPTKGAKDGLAAYLMAANPEARALSVRQPGWSQNKTFVLPDATYGQSSERLVFQTTDPEDLKRFSRKGDLESWQQNVAVPCQGNSRAVISICIGLAPPLLALLGEDNGGFHLRGNSSSGKTVCLGIGASVWGGGALIRTWNMTTNGFEGVATMHNDVLLPLDELGQADGKAAGDAAYMLGNGQGKSRATRDGDARAARRFRNLVLSSGEKSLADLMAQAGQTAMAGQEVRMVEIAADAGCGYGVFENIHGAKTSQVFAEGLKHAVLQHHGHAGRAFVTFLADQALQPKLIEAVREGIQGFLDANVPEGSTGQVGRVGRRFGLIAAVGELCIKLGILPWPDGECLIAVAKCFAGWIEQRGGIGNREVDQAVAQVKRFIELHGESRFTSWTSGIDNNGSGKTVQRAGFRRVTVDGRTEFFILPEVYRTEICCGLNPKFVTTVLIEKGFLATDKQGNSQIEKSLPGMGKKRIYHLTEGCMDDAFSKTEKRENLVIMPKVSKLVEKYSV